MPANSTKTAEKLNYGVAGADLLIGDTIRRGEDGKYYPIPGGWWSDEGLTAEVISAGQTMHRDGYFWRPVSKPAEKPPPHKVIQGKWDFSYHAWRVEDAKRWATDHEDNKAEAAK